MTDVLITGLGIVSPIGIGHEAVARSMAERQSGVRAIAELERAGWMAPFGGEVDGFDPKAYVKPRKSLKIMAREIQLAFAAGELAWADAGFGSEDQDGPEVDPERMGVVGAAGLQNCSLEELADPFVKSLDEEGRYSLVRWGEEGMRQLSPLWMLKYLPNMAACHVGIRRDARGPTNTISLGEVSSLLALGEATEIIRRGAADVMLAGGTSTLLDLTDLVLRGGAGLSLRKDTPTAACRPFDAARDGAVGGEGAAYFVLESRDHAERRGFGRRGEQAWGTVEAIVSRYEAPNGSHGLTGRAIEQAVTESLRLSEVEPSDLAMIKAHGTSRIETDRMEATALQRVVGDVPVTAPTSYFGSIGAAGGAVELAATLISWREGVVPATLNYETPDPDCPVNVSAEARPAEGKAILALSHATTGQAVAATLKTAN